MGRMGINRGWEPGLLRQGKVAQQKVKNWNGYRQCLEKVGERQQKLAQMMGLRCGSPSETLSSVCDRIATCCGYPFLSYPNKLL